MRQWLPKAQAESDRVILLYYGTLTGLHHIREQFGSAFAAVLMGGSRPEDLPKNVEPPVIATSARGRHVAHLRLSSPGDGAKGEVSQVAIEPTTAADDTIATLINQAKGDGASGALSRPGRPELGQPSERSTASETAARQIQDSERRAQQGQEEAPSTPSPSPSERGENTPDKPNPIIVGDSLHVGMPLLDVFGLLGSPASTMVEQGTTSGEYRLRMEYPVHALVIMTHGPVVDAIEVQPAFTGQFPSGVHIGDPVTAIIAAYGMPASMTPERAIYPDKGLVFTFDDAKRIGATVSPPGSRSSEKPADRSSTSLTAEKPSSPHESEVPSPPHGSGKDPRKDSGAQTPEQAMTETTAEPTARQPQAEQPPLPYPGMDIVIPRGTIKAVLAGEVTALSEPITPTRTFPEDAQAIYLALKSELATMALVHASWIPMTGEAPKLNHTWVRPGQRGNIQLKAPAGGFSPGEYRVKISVDHEPTEVLPFTVVPLLPLAPIVAPSDVPRGFNIALAALGGRVVHATSQLDGTTWAAANLTDGIAFTSTIIPVSQGATRRICDPSCGWSSRDRTLPQDIVLAFHQGREARINAVVIDTATHAASVEGKVDSLPKHVEVWASTTSATAGFAKLAGARLQPRAAQYLISLPPTPAQYLKVRVLSNHGGDVTTAAELRVLEANDGPESILRDVPKNLALPSLGGAVVRFRSAAPDTKVGQLVDDSPAREGWRSADGRLPQEFIVAFQGDQVALIDRVVLQPASSHHPTTWPRRISVSVSDESPLDGFQEVGEFTLLREAREQAFPVGRRARFLRLRILENFGDHYTYTSLGKLKVIEGAAEGYESVLRTTPGVTVVPRTAGPSGPLAGTGVLWETEPNGTPAEANALEVGRTLRGENKPKGETDYFKLSVPGSAPTVLTLELTGWPHIRTAATLFGPLGARLKRFDPGAEPQQRTEFSWAVWPGEHLVQVTEPPISMVLIWDTSGSMRGSTDDLRRAVESYIDQVEESERLNLIRFSTPGTHKLDAVEVLLNGFTSDRKRLKAATAGKFFADGGTPLYDAIGRGIDLLEGMEGNRALVVMTDGVDSHRGLSHSGFWARLQAKRIRLYTIGLGFDLQTYWPKLASTGERILAHAAIATNGRFFFARTADELQGLYQQIADELRTVSIYDLRPTLSRGTGSLDVVATGVSLPLQLELILDASGSMKETLKRKGPRKIDIAKDTMVQIIRDLPDNLQVALRVFGHRIREGRPGDCQDSELVVPFGKIDKPRLEERVRRMQALGTTPLAYSLQQVARDFGTARGEKMVILVTDGKEWCGGNPSAVVSELLAKGVQVRLNVVGFDLADAATKQEMQRIAALTGGRFFDAKDAGALHGAIVQALAAPYDVLDAAGSRVASGETGQGAIAVPEGVYTVVMRGVDPPIRIADVRVAYDQFTRVELKKEGQEVGTQVLGPVQKHEAPWAAAAQAAPPAPRRK